MNRILNKAITNELVLDSTDRTGVHIHIDVPGEDVWVEAPFGVDIKKLTEVNNLIECMGFALIEEEPPLETETGLRHYYEQRYFPSEHALSVAM